MYARFVVLFVVCIHFTIDIVTAECIAKDSCDVDCGICEKTDSRDTCTQIGFCAWASSCGPAPEWSWFKTSACTSATVATSEQQDLCALAQSSSACADMDFCEWKDDCRECSKLTANRDCVSRDFCAWDQGTVPKYPITSADIAFTVGSLLCELYTAYRLLSVAFLPTSCHVVSSGTRTLLWSALIYPQFMTVCDILVYKKSPNSRNVCLINL